MPTAPDVVGPWWQVIGPSLGVALLAGIAALVAIINGRKSEPTPPAEIATKAVGAAFVDQSASNTLVKTGEDVSAIRQILERREDREKEEDLKDEIAGRLRQDIERARKSGRSPP